VRRRDDARIQTGLGKTVAAVGDGDGGEGRERRGAFVQRVAVPADHPPREALLR
jgi:hypothetical protein